MQEYANVDVQSCLEYSKTNEMSVSHYLLIQWDNAMILYLMLYLIRHYLFTMSLPSVLHLKPSSRTITTAFLPGQMFPPCSMMTRLTVLGSGQQLQSASAS